MIEFNNINQGTIIANREVIQKAFELWLQEDAILKNKTFENKNLDQVLVYIDS